MTGSARLRSWPATSRQPPAATEGPLLILHDTTEFTDHRVRPEPVGVTGQYPCRTPSYDRRQLFTGCGLLMPASLGVTPDGLPLGLCAIKFWTRASFKGTTELNLPVPGVDEAIEKIGWYALRWKSELFHKILKSGCRAEDAKLRSAERLVNLLALFCILAWRVFWLTMLNRTAPQASPRLILTPLEIRLLDQLVKTKTPSPAPTLAHDLTKVARLGGYLARAKDPPPGNMVIWRGLSRLTDIELGASLSARLVGK
jgi:hypothetical protein